MIAGWSDPEGVMAGHLPGAPECLSPGGVVRDDVLAALDTAADGACHRLEEAVQSILDDGTHLRPEHAERLNALLDQIPISERQ